MPDTMHLTGSHLINALVRTGLEVVRSDIDFVTLASSDPKLIVQAQTRLMDADYRFGSSLVSGTTVYSMLFHAPGNLQPWCVVLNYRNSRRIGPPMALVYQSEGRFVQYTRPYQWWVRDIHSDEAREQLEAFDAEVGADVEHYWVPVLSGSPLAKF